MGGLTARDVRDVSTFLDVRCRGLDTYWVAAHGDGSRDLVHAAGTGGPHVLNSSAWHPGSDVYGYGGGSLAAVDGGVVAACEPDGSVRFVGDGGTRLVLPGPARLGDLTAARGLVVAVAETRESGGDTHELVAFAVDGSRARPIVSGFEFVSSPRLDPAARRLAWLSWAPPDMPWDATSLWVATIADGTIGDRRLVAGGSGESVLEPSWGPDGALYFLSDRTGWWNLYRADAAGAVAIHRTDADFTRPAWRLGITSYGFVDGRTILCTWSRDGVDRLGLLGLDGGPPTEVATGFTAVDSVTTTEGRAVVVGSRPDAAQSVVELRPARGGGPPRERVLAANPLRPEVAARVVQPERIVVRTDTGEDVPAWYYRPRSVRGPAPLIVAAHSGPTDSITTALDLSLLYWVSRGFVVATVNYRGSSGLGRSYRQSLYGRWGLVDVDDCTEVADALVADGVAARDRVAIRGESAGGLTVVNALRGGRTFRAGVAYSGVADPYVLAGRTHKFEAHYVSRLLPPRPPNVRPVTGALLMLHGEDDRIIPPDTVAEFVEETRATARAARLVVYPDEGHGFELATTWAAALAAEEEFYATELVGDGG